MTSLRDQPRVLGGVTLLVSLVSLGCFFASIFTIDMVSGSVSNKDINAENYGDIRLGLIWGTKQYNYGYGDRKAERFMVYEEYTSSKSIKGVTISVLSFLCVACVFNVVGIFLSLENTFIVPAQTLQGPTGLILWYSISAICAFISFVMYSILYPTKLRDNIDSASEPTFTADVTYFGYSYWLILSGTVLVGTNVGLALLARPAKLETPQNQYPNNKSKDSDSENKTLNSDNTNDISSDGTVKTEMEEEKTEGDSK